MQPWRPFGSSWVDKGWLATLMHLAIRGLRPPCWVVAACWAPIRGHRLARRETIIYTDLQGEPIVLWPRATAPETFDDVIHACRAAGFSPQGGARGDLPYTILGLVAAGSPSPAWPQIVHVEVDILDPARTTVVPMSGLLRASWKRFIAFGHP
jgi:DNA-binding transcriptional LysR family regulator